MKREERWGKNETFAVGGNYKKKKKKKKVALC